MKAEIDIDELMADSWLTVVQLRHGVSVQDGEALYQRCQQQVEQVRAALKAADVDAQSIDHISYAQCALLDETALGRQPADGKPDSGHLYWHKATLQARYFGSMTAGEALYDRIHLVLRQPAAAPAVLTCFHRVLLLGFQGQYASGTADSLQREQALIALSQRVPPMKAALTEGILADSAKDKGASLLCSLWFWLVIAVVMTSTLWWGGHLWLQALLEQQLPGLH